MCAISVLVTNRDNCPLQKQVFELNLVKIKISRTPKIPSLKRIDQTPVCLIQDCPPVPKPIVSHKPTMANFLLANCRSLFNKMEDFEVLLRSSNIADTTVTEIWNLDETKGRIAGYNSFLSTRNSRGDSRLGGSVGIYVRKNISCNLLPELTNPDRVVLWVMSVYYPENVQNRCDLVFYLND